MYRTLFDRFLVHTDPEQAHHGAAAAMRLAAAVPPVRAAVHAVMARGGLGSGAVTIFGKTIDGPLGVAAGFDKDATTARAVMMLGFSYVEVGTVTPVAQGGNPRPRLWRLPEQRALRNAMGFNNQGARKVAGRLMRLRRSSTGRRLLVGVNLGKNKSTLAVDAPQDYHTTARWLAPWADYLVVNVSSPNTPGLRELQDSQSLGPILRAAKAGAAEGRALGGQSGEVPLLVKVAPDLSDAELDQVAALALELGLAGVVAVNTTVDHDLGPGGLSGPMLKARGVEVVRRLRQALGEEPVIIGVGGIFEAQDIVDYMQAGANLVQALTAFIYEGPAWAARVQRGAAELMRQAT
ncbi:MAG: quinone-dependent dihydroorotate dehydrogenase [Micrococcales bacterium]|nr:quinone-dependent dihydroorotate dehydrogenase [Micrococcales bacterium]